MVPQLAAVRAAGPAHALLWPCRCQARCTFVDDATRLVVVPITWHPETWWHHGQAYVKVCVEACC